MSSSISTTKILIGDKASDDGNERPPEFISQFDASRDAMRRVAFPDIGPSDNMKTKISTLEDTVYAQQMYNRQADATVSELNNDLAFVDSNLRQAILQLQDHFSSQLRVLKKEYEHRFELQAAENKRLNANVASLKSETSQLNKKLAITITKLRSVQAEFGVSDEEASDDFSVLADSIQRPSTSS